MKSKPAPAAVLTVYGAVAVVVLIWSIGVNEDSFVHAGVINSSRLFASDVASLAVFALGGLAYWWLTAE